MAKPHRCLPDVSEDGLSRDQVLFNKTWCLCQRADKVHTASATSSNKMSSTHTVYHTTQKHRAQGTAGQSIVTPAFQKYKWKNARGHYRAGKSQGGYYAPILGTQKVYYLSDSLKYH